MSDLPGLAVWLGLAVALAGWLGLTFAFPRRLPTFVDLVHWLLGSWAGRLVFLALWAEAGFHVLAQRP